MSRSFLVLGATTLLLSSASFSKTITVTATKIQVPFEKTANSVNIITSEEIKNSTAKDVPELLQSISGIQVSTTGGRGTNTSIFLRGANSGDLVVIIDGIKLNDPSKSSKAPALEHINIDDIEKIEVLKGSQSVLYGSDAIGGVIKITTKRGSGKPTRNIGATVGSGNSYRGSASTRGAYRNINYYLSATAHQEEALSTYKGGAEKDEQKYYNLATNIDANISDDLSMSLNLSYNEDDLELDGFATDDPDKEYNAKTLLAGIGANYLYLDGRAESKIKLNYTNFKRDITDPTDSDEEASYSAGLISVDLFNNVIIDDNHSLALGVEAEQEEDNSDTNELSKNKTTTSSVYTLYQLNSDGPFATAGVRYDKHSVFGSKVSYKVAPGHYFKSTKTKIFANYATNYKAPSLYQLYAMPNSSISFNGGNSNLKAQEGYSYELGMTQEINKNHKLTATYFYQKLVESIEYVNNTYENGGEQKVQGIEAELLSKFNNLETSLNYTYMTTEDKNGNELKKRPSHQAFASFVYDYNDALKFSANINFKGKRADVGGNLGGHTIYNARTSYMVSKQLKLSAKVINLSDKSYEETKGYSTYGRSYYVGGNWSF